MWYRFLMTYRTCMDASKNLFTEDSEILRLVADGERIKPIKIFTKDNAIFNLLKLLQKLISDYETSLRFMFALNFQSACVSQLVWRPKQICFSLWQCIIKVLFNCIHNISEVSVTKIYMKFIQLICFRCSNFTIIKMQFDVLTVYIQIDSFYIRLCKYSIIKKAL